MTDQAEAGSVAETPAGNLAAPAPAADNGSAADGAKARLKAYVNPLVMWVWMGGIVLALGTLIALLPNRKTLPSRRAVRVEKAEEVSKEGAEVEAIR